MEINVSKLRVSRNFETEKVADGSVRLVRYKGEQRQAKELVTLREWSYYGGDKGYLLEVNTPPPRTIDIVIIVSHTSANCWRTVCCTPQSVTMQNFNTLGEVVDFIKSQDK